MCTPTLLGPELRALCAQERAKYRFSTFCINMCVFQGVAEADPIMDWNKSDWVDY